MTATLSPLQISPPTPEEEEAAAAAAEEEQTVLEGMCANDDEVMELRTGLVTPVQLYLRFRVRRKRGGFPGDGSTEGKEGES